MTMSLNRTIRLSPRKSSLCGKNSGAEPKTNQIDYNNSASAVATDRSAKVIVKKEEPDYDGQKRKRRESNENSPNSKDKAMASGSSSPKENKPLIERPLLELKKCKYETERERMYKVSSSIQIYI